MLQGIDGNSTPSYTGLEFTDCFQTSERRMLTLREVGEKTAAAREVKNFWGQVISGLEYNGF